jgi:hypothetical protein
LVAPTITATFSQFKAQKAERGFDDIVDYDRAGRGFFGGKGFVFGGADDGAVSPCGRREIEDKEEECRWVGCI